MLSCSIGSEPPAGSCSLGAPDCRATWRLSTPEELLQQVFGGVVLVIVADQKLGPRGPATCATPVVAAAG